MSRFYYLKRERAIAFRCFISILVKCGQDRNLVATHIWRDAEGQNTGADCKGQVSKNQSQIRGRKEEDEEEMGRILGVIEMRAREIFALFPVRAAKSFSKIRRSASS